MSSPINLPIFVYGTLRPGQPNYNRLLIGRTVQEQPASLAGFCLFSLGSFPMAIDPKHLSHPPQPASLTIAGTLITLHPEHYQAAMQALDRLEGYQPDHLKHSMYWRIRQTVQLAQGSQVEAWLYVGNPEFLRESHQLIPSGDWVAYQSQEQS